MTVWSGAASLAPMAAPIPQPRWPAGAWSKYDPGRSSSSTGPRGEVTASPMTMVLSSTTSAMQRDSHRGWMGRSSFTLSIRAASSARVSSWTVLMRFRRASTLFRSASEPLSPCCIRPLSTGSVTSDEPVMAWSTGKPHTGMEENSGSTSSCSTVASGRRMSRVAGVQGTSMSTRKTTSAVFTWPAMSWPAWHGWLDGKFMYGDCGCCTTGMAKRSASSTSGATAAGVLPT